MKRTILVLVIIFAGYFLLEHPTETTKVPKGFLSEYKSMPMFMSDNGLEMVMNFEKFKSKAYRCPGGRLTIGYGSTRIGRRKVSPTDTITPTKAKEILLTHLRNDCSIITTDIKTSITQNQYDALCSFIYNVGPNQFKRSTLLKKINQNDIAGAAQEFTKWSNIKKNGYLITLPGLKKRRQIEKELFLS